MAYIYKRGKNWCVGYVEGGVPKRKSLHVTSKAAAKDLLGEYQLREARERNESTLLTLKRSIVDAISEYLHDDNHIGKASETLREKRGALARFERFLDARASRMDELSYRLIDDYYKKRLKESLAGANKDLKVIKTFLNECIRRGYLRNNPAKEVKVVKPVKKIFRDLSFDELGTFLMVSQHLYPNLYPITACAYYSGLRMNELVFLEWSDLDLHRMVISVRSKPENRIKDCEERNVPMSEKLKTVLTGLSKSERFVFVTPSGVPWKNNLYRETQKVFKEASLQNMSMQTLRETFGSHLLRRGVSIYLVSKYLGHSSVDVTTRHYAHVPIEETHKEINLL
jgi:integrase